MHDADRFAKGLSVAARLFGRGMVVIACIQLPGVVAQNAAPEAAPPTAFQPGDISIGEPIALPFAPLAAAPAGGAAVAPPPTTAPIAVPGWLGMAVAESTPRAAGRSWNSCRPGPPLRPASRRATIFAE
jgi:hypothetical protein